MSVQTLEANRLAGAPAAYLEPARRPSLAEARAYCKALAESHYENFHVASVLLPKVLRPHFHAVYAYCRIADDLGDEVPDRATALRLLQSWETLLHECYDDPQSSRHPVFVALHESIVAKDLPREPFLALVRAFRADQTKTRFANMRELEIYSEDSANPVGRLVLFLAGYRQAALHQLSDMTCTGLQLANFWQDVSSDLHERDRIYLPQDRMRHYGVTEGELRSGVATPGFRALLAELCADARTRLLEGSALIDAVDRELAATLRLFSAGGLAILDAVERQGFDTLHARPVVGKAAKLRLLAGAALGRLGGPPSSRGLR